MNKRSLLVNVAGIVVMLITAGLMDIFLTTVGVSLYSRVTFSVAAVLVVGIAFAKVFAKYLR